MDWKLASLDEIIRYQGILGDKGIHISSDFICGGLYEDKGTFSLMCEEYGEIYFINFHNKNIFISSTSKISEDVMNEIKEVIKYNNPYDFNNVYMLDDSFNGTVSLGMSSYWYSINENLEKNKKWLTKRRLNKIIPYVDTRIIEDIKDNDLVNLDSEWKRIKSSSLSSIHNRIFKKIEKNPDKFTIVGVYLVGKLIGFRVYSQYGNKSDFIYVETCIEEGNKDYNNIVDTVCSNTELDRKLVSEILKYHTKKLMIYCMDLWHKQNKPYIEVLNIDCVGIETDENDKLLNYKKLYFRDNTLCYKINIDKYFNSVDEESVLEECSKKGIFMCALYLDTNKYLMGKQSGYHLEILDNNFYILSYEGMCTIVGLDKDPIKNRENLKNVDFKRFKGIQKFNLLNIEEYNPDVYTYKMKNNTRFSGDWVTDVNNIYTKLNNKWINKHRLSSYINDDNFVLRELNAGDIENLNKMFNEFKNTKANIKEKFYNSNFYKKCINTFYLDDNVGLFYKDILLGYRQSCRVGNSFYIYVENCISNINTDYFNEICSEYTKKSALEEVKIKVKESSEIAEQIIKLKNDKKWKQARHLSESKNFYGTLEKPNEINLKELYNNIITEKVHGNISFLRTRVKLLLLYKFIEYCKSKGIEYFSVDSGTDERLTKYKESTNSYQLMDISLERNA